MSSPVEPIFLEAYRRIVVLTGAGISVASGLRPYRGPGGLWEEEGVAELANAETLSKDPGAVWKLFGALRPQVRAAKPNPAHLALAQAAQRLPEGTSLTVITQNIDGLHRRAGSPNVVELHGTLARTRCSNTSCDLPPFPDDEPHLDALPTCERCEAPLRPDIVLFDEPLPVDPAWQAKVALRDCDLFLAVGTSGTVSPASNYVRSAAYAEADTILVNLEPMDPPNRYFEEEILGRAEEVLPRLLSTEGADPPTPPGR
jgi:NAD-dependent deacetylase